MHCEMHCAQLNDARSFERQRVFCVSGVGQRVTQLQQQRTQGLLLGVGLTGDRLHLGGHLTRLTTQIHAAWREVDEHLTLVRFTTTARQKSHGFQSFQQRGERAGVESEARPQLIDGDIVLLP